MTPLAITENSLLSLASAMAVRRLSRYGVPPGELMRLTDIVNGQVEDASEKVRRLAAEEDSILATVPEEDGEDRETARFLLILSVYADAGCTIADRVMKKRISEAN
jgi:hypothetical protein